MEFLGRIAPSSSLTLILGTLWQGFKQSLHIALVGKYLDTFLACHACPIASSSEAALAYHQLHQVIARENKVVSGKDEISLASTYACLTSLNLAESTDAIIQPYDLFRVYLAAAVHFRRMDNFLAGLIASYYLRKSHRASLACADQARVHTWIFTAEGHKFFKSGSWLEQTFTLADGAVLLPGSLEHLSHSYRAKMLQLAIEEFNSGAELQQVQERLQELRRLAALGSVILAIPL